MAAAPGIFYVFKDRADAERLLAERSRRDSPLGGLRISDLLFEQYRSLLDPLQRFVEQHRRLPTPIELVEATALSEVFGSIRSAFLLLRRATGHEKWDDIDVGASVRTADRRFSDHQTTLQPLLKFLDERGRLPHPGELSNEAEIQETLGGVRRAFSLVQRVTGTGRWEKLTKRRREDFLVYVSLSAFGGRPRFTELPEDLQHDPRATSSEATARLANKRITSCSAPVMLRRGMLPLSSVQRASSLLRRCTYIWQSFVEPLRSSGCTRVVDAR